LWLGNSFDVWTTCRQFCRGRWMIIKQLGMIPSQAVWKLDWSKARMTFATHKLNLKLKTTPKMGGISVLELYFILVANNWTLVVLSHRLFRLRQ
jgi:hypothetical protein